MEKKLSSSSLPNSIRPPLRKYARATYLVLILFLATILSIFSRRTHSFHPGPKPHVLCTSEWEDNIWPLRPPTPWDISTDFPFPRVLEYDVQSGTWLRLDVHPKTGDIIFDMLGDLYCLAASSYVKAEAKLNTALPILLGVPYDSDPHFSPEGDRIVWRSDAELGVENVWVMKWKGCVEMNLRPGIGSKGWEGELGDALKVKEAEEAELYVKGKKEDGEMRRRRLIREGRLGGTRLYLCMPTTLYLMCTYSATRNKRDIPLGLGCSVSSFR
jgi:hypothetical protein